LKKRTGNNFNGSAFRHTLAVVRLKHDLEELDDMANKLTPRQREYVAAVARLTKNRAGVAPTLQELADDLGVSLNRSSNLAALCMARGALTREPHVARSLRVIETSTRTSRTAKRSAARA